MANTLMLGIGDLGSSRDKNDIIKTLGLGSCVAVVLLDPPSRTVGMVHIALPDSTISTPDKIKLLPGRFADTGIPELINDMKKKGAQCGHSTIVKLIGGASVLDMKGHFNIGQRNLLAIKKILWQFGMGARSEDVGKNMSRSVSAILASGKVKVSSPGRGEWFI